MDPCRDQREKEYCKHLRIDALYYFFPAHSHFHQNIKSILVFIAFRYLLIVHDKDVHIKVIKKVIDFALDYRFTIQGITTSPIKGAKGNIEYLCYFVYKGIKSIDNIENLIEKVVYNSESSVNS